jgi:hypothetical protein
LLRLVFGFFVARFSNRRIMAILTNRLYHISTESKKIIEDLPHAEETNKLRTRPSGDIEVAVPFYLDIETMFYYLGCC